MKRNERHNVSMTWRGGAAGLMTALFLTACAGCSASREAVIPPPQSLLADCPHPATPDELARGSDVRAYALGITRLVVTYGEALDRCNADKAGLRAWYAAMREGKEMHHD